jgi:hypothetical protein
VGYVQTGDTLDALGRNPEGDWLKVRTESGKEAWIHAGLVTLHLDAGELPIEKNIPTPVPTTPALPTPTVGPAGTPPSAGSDWTAALVAQIHQGLPGGSLADQELQFSTLYTIVVFETIADLSTGQTCETRRIVNTEVIEPPHDVRMEGDRPVYGIWAESWTLDRCGDQVRYRIDYVFDEAEGGTSFWVSPQ